MHDKSSVLGIIILGVVVHLLLQLSLELFDSASESLSGRALLPALHALLSSHREHVFPLWILVEPHHLEGRETTSLFYSKSMASVAAAG